MDGTAWEARGSHRTVELSRTVSSRPLAWVPVCQCSAKFFALAQSVTVFCYVSGLKKNFLEWVSSTSLVTTIATPSQLIGTAFKRQNGARLYSVSRRNDLLISRTLYSHMWGGGHRYRQKRPSHLENLMHTLRNNSRRSYPSRMAQGPFRGVHWSAVVLGHGSPAASAYVFVLKPHGRKGMTKHYPKAQGATPVRLSGGRTVA